MKKSIVFWVMMVLMAVIGNYAIAEEYYLEKNTEGKFRVAGWQKTEIRVEEKALPYESFFQEAIENSGVPVVVQEKVMPLEMKLLKVTWFIQKKEIVYNDSTKLIDFADNSEPKEEQGPTILFGIILVAAFFMLVANGFFFFNVGGGLTAFIASLISMVIIAIPISFGKIYLSNPFFLASFILSAIAILIGIVMPNNKFYICGILAYYFVVLRLGYLLC